MGSSELFHFIPSPLSHWAGLWQKGLSVSHSLARLFILQTDTMFLKPCSSCSHAFSLAALKNEKKGVFSRAPSLSFPEEKRVGVVVRGAAMIQPLSLLQEPWPCRPCLLPNPPNLCKCSNVANKTVLFKGAKVSRVWNGSFDTVNVPGLQATVFNQRLNPHCITFPSLAQWQLPHHSPLFTGNSLQRSPLRSGLTMFISVDYLFFPLLFIYLPLFLI